MASTPRPSRERLGELAWDEDAVRLSVAAHAGDGRSELPENGIEAVAT